MRPARMPLCALAAATLAAGLAPAPPSLATPATASAGDVVAAVAAPSDDVRPVTPTVRTVAVTGVSPHGLNADLPALASGSYAALTGPEPVSGVAVAGVTWQGPVPAGLHLSVRTRTNDAWSGWTPLEYEQEHGPSAGSSEARQARPGTDPVVLGAVDQVQLRVTSDTGALPADMELDLVDPGRTVGTPTAAAPTSMTSGLPASEAAGPASGPSAAAKATPMPAIFSRSEWGADERLTDCCVEYGEVHAAFVHHTVNANDYTRAQTPAVVRGIYAYHTQSRGWRDIGYNFLIDKFGRIWEGRAGGMRLPVVGAHTLDYNDYAFAASAIGNFETVRPNSVMVDAYARLFAWKLSLHGVRPGSRQLVGGTVFDAVNGHRDAAQTACPGRYLYARVPAIVRKSSDYQRGSNGRDLQHSFVPKSQPDALLVAASGRLSFARGTGAPGFDRPQRAATGFGDDDQVVAVGDVTGDGHTDVMARRASSGVTATYPGRGDGTFGAAVRTSRRWAGTDLFAGPGDLNSDRIPDLVARDASTRALLFYAGRDDGTFGAGAAVIDRFGGATLLTAAGDFDRDGFRDVLVRDGRGALVLRPGTGVGTFAEPVELAPNWSRKDLVAGGFDASGDRVPDVVARNGATGVLRIFANVDGERLSHPIGSFTAKVEQLSFGADSSGDRKPDLVAVSARGRLVVMAGHRQNWLSPLRERALTWAGMDRPMIVGDWDRDGNVDAMARDRSTGEMWLYPGTGRGRFGPRVGGWGNWNTRTLITPVGDFDGDGRPDLMARAKDGRIYWHPGRGDDGFGKRRVARASGFPSGAGVVAVGLWDNDGAPDVLVRLASGAMWLYRGNGPGGLEDPVAVGRGFDRYNALVGVGDLTGDGQSDLLGRAPAGDVWLIPGLVASQKRPAGAFAPRLYVATGWAGYRLA